MSPTRITAKTHPLAQASGVYLIVCVGTRKVYVGSAQKFWPRWAQHLRKLKRGNHHSWKLQQAFNVYGEAAFEFRPLLRCELKDLMLFEARALMAYKAVDEGYNVSRDVESPMRGRKHTEAARAKMSGPRGPMSEGTKQRMRESAALRPPPTDEFKAKVAEGVRAYYAEHEVSEETRKKLADTSTGRPVSEKSRLALIERNKSRAGKPGHPLTEEHRQKLVASNVARAGTKVDPAKAEELRDKKRAGWARRAALGLKRGDGKVS